MINQETGEFDRVSYSFIIFIPKSYPKFLSIFNNLLRYNLYYHMIHPFEVYSSMAFTIFTEWCIPHHD